MDAPGRILATGGGGRLGQALGRLGAVALDRVTLDITEAASIQRAIEKERPAIVINAAAYTNVEGAETDKERAFQINADGAGNVARVCTENDITMIHISTDYVFGDGDPATPIKEDAPTGPLSVYGESKLAGEEAVRRYAPNAIIARVSWLYDGGENTFVDKMLKFAATRNEMMVVDEAYGRPTHVDHLAAALLSLADLAISKKEAIPSLLHIGPPEPASRFDWASVIFEASTEFGGPNPALKRCSSDAFPTKVRHPLGLVLDVSEADELLGPLPDWRIIAKDAVCERLDHIQKG